MANQEKNKYQDEILIKQIEEFVAHLSVEKNYALNTVSAYKRDLLKFLSFLDELMSCLPILPMHPVIDKFIFFISL